MLTGTDLLGRPDQRTHSPRPPGSRGVAFTGSRFGDDSPEVLAFHVVARTAGKLGGHAPDEIEVQRGPTAKSADYGVWPVQIIRETAEVVEQPPERFLEHGAYGGPQQGWQQSGHHLCDPRGGVGRRWCGFGVESVVVAQGGRLGRYGARLHEIQPATVVRPLDILRRPEPRFDLERRVDHVVEDRIGTLEGPAWTTARDDMRRGGDRTGDELLSETLDHLQPNCAFAPTRIDGEDHTRRVGIDEAHDDHRHGEFGFVDATEAPIGTGGRQPQGRPHEAYRFQDLLWCLDSEERPVLTGKGCRAHVLGRRR